MRLNDSNMGSTIHYSRHFSLHDVLLFLSALEKSFDVAVSELHGVLNQGFSDFSAFGRGEIDKKLQPKSDSVSEKYLSLRFTFCKNASIEGICISSHEWVDGTVYFLIEVSFFASDNSYNIIESIGGIFASLKKNISGFALVDVSNFFTRSYAGGSLRHRSEFSESIADYYSKFEEELFWYRRLARPIELMNVYGLFRNVYPYNFLCEEQIFSLKLLFESQQFPILSADTEDRLNKRSKWFTSGEQKPALPGEIIPIGSNAAMWCVPHEKRKPAFDILNGANLTLYRFFINHTELFSSYILH